MVLPESPLLTFSFAMWALSFETALRSATSLVCSVRSHRPLHLHARLYAAEFLKTTVDSEAARTGPAAKSTKPNIERPRPRLAPTRQKIGEADASNTTGQMKC